MGFIGWIVVGAIAGLLASLIVGSRQGLLATLALGILGGLIGGFLATNVLRIGAVSGASPERVFIAMLGGVLVVALAGMFRGSLGLRLH